MGKRRTRIDIINDILRAIKEKGGLIKPTHLLYKANLSYQLLTEYVDELKKKGLVEEIISGKKTKKKEIRLTDKGYYFLEEYQRMKEFQESFGL